MRVRKKPGAMEALLAFDTVYMDTPMMHRGAWQQVFGNDAPIYAEFGGGKGGFIIEMAKRHPDINFIMVDVITEVMLKAAEKAAKADVPNLRLIKLDLAFLDQVFAPDELTQIYLNFSDPWPKKRHYKRRLTYRDFLMKYREVLKPDGWINFKTDNQLLFEFSLNEFADCDMKMRAISLNLHSNPVPWNVMTEYERKFSEMGMPIYRVEAQFRL
ncbi:MAG: tRNA (guanine-N7-)-methyltransferase [Clostridiales bacterium]|nr:tRNA (guanine-N7-)-methyltransferase [Clostridiales bacterium]MDN5297741.1 tRNA (guanine-N7-)-methyltransferase [Clostridiales bacterium]